MATSREITLYIVRHGECMGNVAQKFIDPFEDVLTDVGKAQAELLGDHLKDIPFTHVYASDYPRTHETCRGILKQSQKCSNAEIKLEPRIRERNYTGMIGISASKGMDILTSALQSGTPYLSAELPKSETVEKFESRIISFFTEAIETLMTSSTPKNGGQDWVLIVSHGMTIQRLMVLLNSRASQLGLQSWTNNLYAERLMRNTSYHKIILKIIPPGEGASSLSCQVIGHVEDAHCRDHVDGTKDDKAKDCSGNYSYMEDNKADSKTEAEKAHYCVPA